MRIRRRRLGLYGGAFDPPHRIHRHLIQQAVQHLGLDGVSLVPSGVASHRPKPMSPGHHRLQMARLQFGDLSRVHIDSREVLQDGPSYTITTLNALQTEHAEADWFLLMGEDQARALSTWHRWEDLVSRITVCVAARGGLPPATSGSLLGMRQLPSWCWLPICPSSVSATQARRLRQDPQSLRALVGEPVARYIEDQNLYSSPE